MPVIVIVLMFLVAFLLAVIAMIAAPLLGVGYALWDGSRPDAQRNASRLSKPAR
jgi:hypothetical protein